MTHRDDMAGRALHALGPEERRRFDEQADAATLAELVDMQETAAALGGAVPVVPPAELRARILGIVAQTEQEPPPAAAPAMVTPVASTNQARAEEAHEGDDSADRDPDAEQHEPALIGSEATTAGPRERSARRRWFQRPGSVLGAAAAASALLVAGVGIGQAIRTPDPVTALVHASDVSTQTETLPDGTRATVLSSTDLGDVALVFQGLATLDDEQVYEAWLMRDGVPIAAGTFQGGDGSVVHLLDGEMQVGDGVAVTIEPAGGSEQPTSEPLMVMST